MPSTHAAAALPDGDQDFTGYVANGAERLSPDGFFRLTASEGTVNADSFGAFISGTASTSPVYLEVSAIGGLGTFEITTVGVGEFSSGAGADAFTNVTVMGYLGGSLVAQTTPYTSANGNFQPQFPISFAPFNGIQISSFRVIYTAPAGTSHENFNLFSFSIADAALPAPAPTVTDGNISISGASGTGGAYKTGDTVAATWNNTAGGDNNSDAIFSVTVDFSQFGGGAAVAATNSSGTWTATYTLVAGAIDATNRNVSVSATNSGDTATTADTTNATVDNVAPTVTDARISISGASGTGGAFKTGDTVTASWNNTAGGDNNADTMSGVTVSFSQFGGGAAVAATNSSGTWTATYTLVAGAIDGTNRNVTVTATDNAGNATTTADTTNATVDTVAPTATNANISISGASGTGGAFKIGDTVTATWNNTAGGDNNSDTISGVTVNFAQFGGGAAVVATNSSGTWTATYTITSGAIDTTNRNVSVTATDNAGNTTTTADTTNATVDSVAPFVSDVYIGVSGASGMGGAFKIGDTVTATWDNSDIGDDNSDTISGVTVNFTQFGGAAVVATNSSGTWTATYTITAGAIDGTNRNVSVTATDNAGNTTTRADTTNATVDNVAPIVTDGNISISGASGTGGAFKIGDTVTATWNNTAGGDNNSDTISGVTVNFSQFGGGAAVAATNSSGTWTATYTLVAGTVDGTIRNVAVTATDNAGNTTTTADTTNATVDNVAPTVASVSVPANATYSVGQNLDFTVNFSEAVTVNTGGGTPYIEITLNTGGTVQAAFISGSGTSALVFRYTVAAGNQDADGVAVATAITANGGTLRDPAANDTTLTLNSVGSMAAVLVDGVRPTVDIAMSDYALTAGETATVTFTFSKAVTGFANAHVTAPNGTLTTVVSSDGGVTWTATFTPAAGVEDVTNAIGVDNTGYVDAAGNTGTGTTGTINFTIDTLRPTAAIVVAEATLAIGETSLVTITFSEAVAGFANGDLTVPNGTLSAVSSSDGGITWTATFTPTAGIEVAMNAITLDNTGVVDAAGNTGSGTTDSNTFAIDTLAPLNTVPAAQTTTTIVPLVFSSGNGNAITVSDGGALTTVVSVGAGTLTATTGGGATITNNGTAAVTLDGTAAQVNAALAGLTYAPNGAGAQTIAVQSVDAAGNSDNDTIAVTVDNATVVATSNLDTGGDETVGASFAADQADGSGLSIREALAWARAGDTITFDFDSATAGNQGGTIVLNGNAITVSHGITIDGDLDDDGTPDLTISGNNASRVMQIDTGITGVNLNGLTLSNGSAISGGAGLNIGLNGSVTLRDSVVADNTESGLGGGGIYGSGTTLTLINTTVSGNNTDNSGGGIRSVGASTLNLINSTVSGNTTTGAGAHGGGIEYAGSGLTIVNSTISGNATLGATSMGGGLRITAGTSFVYNTTIVGNASIDTGGGVSADGTDTFVNTVVTGNTAGAGATAGAGGSPLATGGSANDVSETVETATHCFFGTAVTITTNTASLNAQGTASVLLGNLGLNGGGGHQTHKPQTGSALIDAGSNVGLPADTHDLDGDSDTSEALPVDANGNTRVALTVDIGAVEGDTTPTIIAVSATAADGVYKAGDTLTITVEFDLTVAVDTAGGTPTLTLETGATDRAATYVSGSGTTTLAFAYTVQAGDASPDLDYTSTSALALNGATISSAGDFDALLTLPVVGGPDSLAGQKAIVIDTIPPVITSGASTSAIYRTAFSGYTITANGAVSFGATGLPAGMSVNTGTGALTGAPTQAGSFSVAISATDAAGNTGTANLALTVDRATLTVSGVTVADRSYDGTTSATVVTSGATLVGVLGGDDVTLVGSGATGTFADPDAGSGKPVTITGLTLGGTHAAGYTLTQPAATGTISKADQTITFTPVGAVTIGSPVNLSSTASSGLPVTFSLVSGDAAISGDDLTVNSAAASVVVRATQSGNGNYNAASADQAIVSTDISRLVQTITFAQPADKLTTDAAFALSATVSSGLAVTFAVQSGPATINGSTVTLTGAPGAVTVVASQAGGDAYDAAPSVTRSFAVTSPAPLICFGVVSQGGQSRGKFAAYLAGDGASGMLIGYIPGHGGFVVAFTPDANGAFTADGGAAAPATWTFEGQVQGNTLSGTLAELGYTFVAQFDPIDGATAALSGFYAAPSLDTTTGQIYTIVGTTGTVYVLAVLPDLVDGDGATINATTGDFTVQTSSGVVIEGNVDAPTLSVDGAVIRAVGGEVIEFSGVRLSSARTDRLINLSSRARVGTGEEVLITGFVIGGVLPRQMLLRAVGPGLDGFDVTGTLSDPRLALMQGGAVVGTNDDWGQAPNANDIAAAFASTGAFTLASDSRDAAMLVTLQPGSYTVVVNGANEPGVALAEIYDASTTTDAERLVNISARGHVGPGDDILIGGFIVTGNAPKRVLVRGVGPTLARYAVLGTLVDPVLVVRQHGAILAQNDDWGAGVNTAAELTSAASATSAFTLDVGSKDAAIIVTLAPGAYTAQVASATGQTGVALVEIYEIPE